ncbi:ABC transporter substrate-binding protein [Alkalicoccobacillus murimartini]|uniref:Multiple sugar transport system substrate-binding protein n=1 Tax=Alkalicoccobacillus murimartini TaxID=171685 RepID=A0ABT9YK14_9BACI|nr:ABC transporter substrate-binding protein [Alkalicoccobacillus murimartini]MDQ0208195.1 multiple sugar transport system substrate-binding protein [Alkalicoccobacillus murimartini]
MKKKMLFLSASMLSLSLALAACGGSSDAGGDANSGGSEGNGDDEQITLRMSWWGSQERHDMTFKIIEMYEEANPHVKIEPEFTGFDGYFERMAAQAAGNNLPDIMQQNFGEYLNLYASQGLLTDLNEFVDDGTIDLSKVDESIVQSGMKDDQFLGMPTGTNALTVMYNKEMIEEAGAELPTNDWTWEDFDEIATKVHEELDTYGTRSYEAGNIFEYFLRENGYALFNDDGTDLGYEDDQLLTDYLTRAKTAVDDGVAPGYDVVQQIQGIEDEIIVHKNVPFDLRWSNQVKIMSQAADYSFDLNVLPGDNIQQGMYLKPAMLWSVSENSAHKQEAANFINFFTNTEEVFEAIGSDRGVPVNNEIRENMRADLDEVETKIYDYIDFVTENSSPIDTNFPSQSSEILQELNQIDERVMYGQITPEEGAEEFRKAAGSILGN